MPENPLPRNGSIFWETELIQINYLSEADRFELQIRMHYLLAMTVQFNRDALYTVLLQCIGMSWHTLGCHVACKQSTLQYNILNSSDYEVMTIWHFTN